MTCKLFVYLLAVMCFISGYAADTSESLLNELDAIIRNQSEYTQKRNLKIYLLKKQIDTASDDILKFSQLDNLFNDYRNYKIDSALVIAKRMIKIAENLDETRQYKAQMRLADAMNKLGEPAECIFILNRIPRTEDIKKNSYFYYLYHTAYLSLSKEDKNIGGEYDYSRELKNYKDTIVSISKPGGEAWITNKAGLYAQEGNIGKGIDLLISFYEEQHENGNKNLASIEYQLGELYLEMGDTATSKMYFIKSSICDLKAAKYVYKSLQQLAEILYKEGDSNRAYNYIMKAMYDITAGHARYRVHDIAEYLPIITATHDRQQADENMIQLIITLFLGLVLAMMIVFYIMLRRKNRVVAEAMTQVTEQNVQLQKLMENLQLSNSRLRESDDIKVEYIALLFNTCSEYIREQEDFRKRISQKLASKQTADVMKLVNIQTSESDNFKQFIRKFDSIFNYLFPNFVNDFNQFLRPEEQIQLKPGELLTPELRIYALIRLGITENGKIADFLHYSVQTVYNYRQKMRNKAINKGESLSAKMRNIVKG